MVFEDFGPFDAWTPDFEGFDAEPLDFGTPIVEAFDAVAFVASHGSSGSACPRAVASTASINASRTETNLEALSCVPSIKSFAAVRSAEINVVP